MKKKFYLVLDVETANSLEDALVYDIGYAVIDNKGDIYKTASYVIRDIFIKEKDLMPADDLMDDEMLEEDMTEPTEEMEPQEVPTEEATKDEAN